MESLLFRSVGIHMWRCHGSLLTRLPLEDEVLDTLHMSCEKNRMKIRLKYE